MKVIMTKIPNYRVVIDLNEEDRQALSDLIRKPRPEYEEDKVTADVRIQLYIALNPSEVEIE